MIEHKEIDKAVEVLAPHLVYTPMRSYTAMSDACGLEVYTKLELRQKSGSFKARGAFFLMLSIPESERKRAFFAAASTGNHAIAFCTALQELGLKGMVFLPRSISPAKLSLIAQFEIPYQLVGNSSLDAELHCRAESTKHGYIVVPPYNDPRIIVGQGTVAVEILDQLSGIDVVVVPVGGGGLISGVATYLKACKPSVHIIGCQPKMSPEMVRSIQSGQILTEDISGPTLSDGTAGGLEEGSLTFSICQQLVDEWCLVSEHEIAVEISNYHASSGSFIEGSAALPLACIRKRAKEWSGKKALAILTGNRLNRERYIQMISSSDWTNIL
ncbi:MAG: pyridoxal-phosphate dependent enzyme [Saprospiraceae bacterium]|nr:pyridoxal-phosphate dependent enzyme [Saprospiraceae bacterium]